ncbi:ATP-binding protein [uncultured Ramlibacter sp.]|uniref:ATP-binding protein n=1 Tax=uncultured Ramlibacter sp. TaxID=260755 RepID=UPI00261B8144|nr:ATP-binding protein [uncultured Ramlibacter sp.]
MPRLTLQRKFFIALALLLALLLALFTGLSRLGLQRGIGAYVAEIELSRLDWMVANLQRIYTRDGNWNRLRGDSQAWHAAQMPGGMLPVRDGGPPGPPRGAGPDRGPGFGPGGPGRPLGGPQLDVLPDRYTPPPPPGRPGDPRAMPGSIYSRLALLAADGSELIAGNASIDADALRTPVQVDGRTVGWLALAPLAGIGSAADQAFIAQQSRFIIYTGLAGLLLALLLSAALARRWLRPVEQLVGAASAVADGRLNVAVPVQGNDELADLSQTFNAMAAKLAAVEQSRQQWLSDVAHELRTPVAAVRAEIEAVQDGVRSFDAGTARRLHGQVMRLGQLVDDLRLGMEEAYDPQALQATTAEPLQVLLDAAEAMAPRLAQRGIRIEGLDSLRALQAGARPRVRGDDGRLAQVTSNLLENSLRYTDTGGTLRLFAALGAGPGSLLTLVVEDSAPAPRREDLPRLFERFFRGEASRARASGGAGLGLAICKAIVQAHGGSIAAALSPLGGLRITITLPVAPA